MELRLPAIRGIGGAPLYLIDRFEDDKLDAAKGKMLEAWLHIDLDRVTQKLAFDLAVADTPPHGNPHRSAWSA